MQPTLVVAKYSRAIIRTKNLLDLTRDGTVLVVVRLTILVRLEFEIKLEPLLLYSTAPPPAPPAALF